MSEFIDEMKNFLPDELLPKNNNRPSDTILKGELVMMEAMYNVKQKQETEEFYQELSKIIINTSENLKNERRKENDNK